MSKISKNVLVSTEAYTKAVFHCLKYPTQPIFGLLVGKEGGASPVPSGKTNNNAKTTDKNNEDDHTKKISMGDEGAGAAAASTERKEDEHTEGIKREERSSSAAAACSCTGEEESKKTAPCVSPTTASSPGAHVEEEDTVRGIMVLDAIPLFHSSIVSAPNPLVEVALGVVQNAVEKYQWRIVGMYIANERMEDRKVSPLLLPLAERILQHIRDHPLNTHCGGEDCHTSNNTDPNSKEEGENGDERRKKAERRGEGKSLEEGMVFWMMDNLQLCNPPQLPCLTSLWLSKPTSSWSFWSGKVNIPTLLPHKSPHSEKSEGAGVDPDYLRVSPCEGGVEGSALGLQYIYLVSTQPGFASMGKSAVPPPFSCNTTKSTSSSNDQHTSRPPTFVNSQIMREAEAFLGKIGNMSSIHDIISPMNGNKLYLTDAMDLNCLMQGTFVGHLHYYLCDMEDHLEDPTINFVHQPLSGLMKQLPSKGKGKKHN